MSDQLKAIGLEASGYAPLTTLEIDCAASAKGDINVSWRIKIQMPTENLSIGELVANGRMLRSAAIDMSSAAKYEYINLLEKQRLRAEALAEQSAEEPAELPF